MQSVVTFAAACALLSALSALGAKGKDARLLRITAVAAASGEAPGMVAACPRGTLPDANACVPVPLSDESGGLALPEEHNAHRDRSGRWQEYDQIPRLPERPADYHQYKLPVPALPDQSFVMSGYDLDRPDAEQRRGAELHAVGHGGIDIAQKRGTEVHLVRLDHQEGDSEVIYVGPLFGNTVVMRQVVREGGALREYLVLHGHLERAASGLARGALLPEGAVLGFVGDSGSPGVVHLHYEARRVREGFDGRTLEPGEITQELAHRRLRSAQRTAATLAHTTSL